MVEGTRVFGPPVNRQLITAIQCNHWTYSLSLVVAAYKCVRPYSTQMWDDWGLSFFLFYFPIFNDALRCILRRTVQKNIPENCFLGGLNL